jgi:hypothetical protein
MYLLSYVRQCDDVLVQLALVFLLHSLLKDHTTGIQPFVKTSRKLLLFTIYLVIILLTNNLAKVKVVFHIV